MGLKNGGPGMNLFTMLVLALLAPACPAGATGLDNALSVVTGSWTADGNINTVALARGTTNSDTADLYVYSRQDAAKPILTVQDIVSVGMMAGNLPSLSVAKNGALLIWSGNDAIGRDHWEQTLTVVYRNGQFLLAGFTFSSYDTINPKLGGNCDLNLLTGHGVRNGKRVKFDLKPKPLQDWNEDSLAQRLQVQACKL